MGLRIICDNSRHLVCLPYTVENLHKMAQALGIKRCWFHAGSRWPHYDIPKRRVQEIQNDPRVEVVTSRSLLKLIKAG